MNLGGRRAVYDLMDMEPPPLPGPPSKIKVPKLEIDRTGQSDQARYTGLKMGQILDDDLMGEVLAKTQEKAKKGETLRPKLMEEEYELPFAGKILSFGGSFFNRNVFFGAYLPDATRDTF